MVVAPLVTVLVQSWFPRRVAPMRSSMITEKTSRATPTTRIGISNVPGLAKNFFQP